MTPARERSGGAPYGKNPIAEFDSEQLRGAYFAIYDEAEISRPASSYMEKVQEDDPKIDCYEGWSELPYNADLISLYWPASSGCTYEGVWRRCKKQDEDETPQGGELSVQLVAQSKQLLGRPFPPKEQKALFHKHLETVEEMLTEQAEKEGSRCALFGLDDVAERWAASHGKARK